MAGQKLDKYANIAFLSVTESAATTLTFEKLDMATPMIGEKYALLIHRAECYFAPATWALLIDGSDQAVMGLTLTDRLTSISDLSQPELLFNIHITQKYFTGAGFEMVERPTQKDFSSLPGGGLLVPGDRLYIGAQGVSIAAAITASMRLYYSVIPIGVSDYWELIEARRVMTT